MSSIALSTANGSISAQPSPYAIGDHDSDGIADSMVKFNRQEVISIVDAGDEIEINITGKIGGMKFTGVDVIRVIN